MADYISREDAVEWFMSFIMMDEDNIPADTVVGDLKTAIPAADVEPVRHARWKLIGADKRGRGGVWECTGADGCGKIHPYKCRYCPNCGVKMDMEDGNG